MRTPHALVMYYTQFILHICASKRNDALASERSIFSKNHDYKSFLCVGVNPLVPIFWDLRTCAWWQKTTNKHTHTHTHMHTHTRRHTHTHTRTHTHAQTHTHTHTRTNTHTHTHTWDNYSNPRCTCVLKVKYIRICVHIIIYSTVYIIYESNL